MNINILRAAIEFSSDGILISDIDGNVIYVNDAYEQTTGLKKERLINKNLRTLQEEKLFNRSVSLSVLENRAPESIIHKYVSGKTALTTANPIYDENKVMIGVICNTRNISELLSLRNDG